MPYKQLITGFLLLCFLSCQTEEDVPEIQKLHTNWLFKSKQSDQWNAASVPGNVYTDLLENDLIPDPFIKDNEKQIQWVSDSVWVYKTSFDVNQSLLNKDYINLVFEGLDTYATLYLNDSILRQTSNAFLKYNIPVKDHLKPRNELRIEFYPTKIREEEAKKKLNYELPEGDRVFTRKAQYQYGWDWGPTLKTAGIWKNVYLEAWNQFKLEDFYIKEQKISDSLAVLDLSIESHKSHNLSEDLRYEIYINNKLHTKIKENQKSTFSIQIQNPKLWWPHNLGEPYLYEIRLEAKIQDKLLASKTIKKGLRTIELISKKDSTGQSFYFEVNGKPIYAKGSNYIPQHSFPSQVDATHYEKLLNDVVKANMNMLRVWGGGIYEKDLFYQLCDEKGILVWQDFMFACAMYPGDQAFLKSIEEEAIYQVKRLRNHASIALWCGNNENSEGWHRWGWQADKTAEQKREIWFNYLKVFDSILPNTVDQLSNTSYWESSPKYGRGNPRYKTEGDAHDWWVWHDAYPLEHLENNVPRFMSEFGFQSFPSYQTLKFINQTDSLNIKSEFIKFHQKHQRGFQLIEEYLERDYPIPANDSDYVYVSQLLQARGIVMGIEAHRRSKPYNMGTLYWQLNDCWPAISWSSIDYLGHWKALHYKVKDAYDNVLISTTTSKYDYDTYLINDSFESISDTLQLKILNFQGKVIWSNTKQVNLNANSSEKVYHIPQVNIYRAGFVYVIEFHGKRSIYYFEKPKNLKLPPSEISIAVKKVQGGFEIDVYSKVLEKDVFLYTSIDGNFSDNFFDLLPGESRTIMFYTKAQSPPKFKIKTLNNLLTAK